MRHPLSLADLAPGNEPGVISEIGSEPSVSAAAAVSAEQADPVWMGRPDQRSLVEIHTVSGPGAGRVWPLGAGVHDIGSAPGSAIEIAGRGVPERGVQVKIGPSGQAWLTLSDDAEVMSHLIRVNVISPPERGPAPRRATGEVPWPTGDDLVVGEVVLRVTEPSAADAAVTRSPDGPGLDYKRAPRTVPPVPSGRFRLPQPPGTPPRLRSPVTMMIAPILIGIGLAWLLKSFFFLVFVLFGSVFVVLNGVRGRRNARRAVWSDLKDFWERRAATYAAIRQAVANERKLRCDTLIDPACAALTAIGPGHRLWERRRGDADHLVLRVGTRTQPSMIEVEDPSPQDPRRTSRWIVPDVPIALDLAARGVLGLAGEGGAARAVAGWLVVQAAVLHSPRELQICVLTDGPGQAVWDWVRWLPHARLADDQGDQVVLVGSDSESVGNCIGELVWTIRERGRADTWVTSQVLPDEPDIIVVFDGARRLLGISGMVQILTEGPALRVFSICLDEQERMLPAECTGVVRCFPTELTVHQQDLPEFTGIRPDLISPAWCDRVARSLTELRDIPPDGDAVSARQDSSTDVSSVS